MEGGREREREGPDRNPVSMIAIDWNRGEGEYRSYTAPASPPMTGRTSSRSVVPDDFEGRVLHSVEYCVRLLELGWIKIFRDFFLFFFFFFSKEIMVVYICTVFTVCNSIVVTELSVRREVR